jgi:hypothetical protein
MSTPTASMEAKEGASLFIPSKRMKANSKLVVLSREGSQWAARDYTQHQKWVLKSEKDQTKTMIVIHMLRSHVSLTCINLSSI